MVSKVKEGERFAVPPWLQEAWIRQLRGFFSTFNTMYLQSRLKPPLFLVGASSRRLGEWNPLTRSITISERHILDHPWESVLETLRHEMAHQFVHDVLGLADAEPHGDAFARACRLLRCEASSCASGSRLGDIAESTAERDKILTRVKELLALAGSPNEHEAASAMRMANKYLLKHNLDLAELEGQRRYETRHLGRSSVRIQEYEYTLARILDGHFFVMVIWVYSYDALANRNGRLLQISGSPENLEIAEYVYRYVLRLAESLWEEQRRARHSAGGTKLQYLAGLLRGLEEKLDQHRKSLKEEHGLIWLGDSQLKEYFKHLHPRIHLGSGSGVSRSEQFHAGLRAGRQITIHRGVSGGASNDGRLLSGGD